MDSSGNPLAQRPRTQTGQIETRRSLKLAEQRIETYRFLCAILKGGSQIFWSLQRMPVSPDALKDPEQTVEKPALGG